MRRILKKAARILLDRYEKNKASRPIDNVPKGRMKGCGTPSCECKK